MKTTYKGISVYTSEAIQDASIAQLGMIDKALVAAAYRMRDDARKLFVFNRKGYQVQPLEDGIMLGRLKKTPDGSTSITLHAFGNNTNRNSYKARFFAGGAYHRKTRLGRYRGSVEDLKTIEESLDTNILENYINNIIR